MYSISFHGVTTRLGEKACPHIAISLLVAIGFACETARAEIYWDLVTPLCILGFENISMIEKCELSYPEMKAEISQARDAWKKRNTESLKKISTLCKARLTQIFEDYDIKTEERDELAKGAKQFIDKLIDENRKTSADLASACRKQIQDMNADKMNLLNEDYERSFAEIPADVLFMRARDSSFRKTAPAGNSANYHRDRQWDFADVAGSIKTLKIGKTDVPSMCLHQSVERCIAILGQSPDERRLSKTGEEHLIYYGKKLLYRGTPKNNHAVGPEWRILVVKDGKISKEYEVLQLMERKEHFREAYPSCEDYGGRNTRLCSGVELIE